MNNEKCVKMTSKKALHRFTALAGVLLVVCLVFMMPVSAETHTDHTTGWTELTSTTTIISGNYYLSSDLTSPITIPANTEVTICLNGKSITVNSGSAITVNKGAVLNLTDCSETHGKITGGNGTMGGFIGPGTFGGGILVNDYGTLNMYGGNITNCIANTGGGVYIRYGTFNMYGGTIYNCSNGEVTEDLANLNLPNGGGVAAVMSKFTMTGGSIVKCTGGISGGGIYLSDSEFTMSDGKISECSAMMGGGVMIPSFPSSTATQSFTLTGNGEISDCKATASNLGGGGGVMLYGGPFTMSGGKITNCESSGDGGGICIVENGKEPEFTMTDGEISGCNAENAGGGVSISEGTFSMSGGKISECTDKVNSEDNGGISTSVDLSISGSASVGGVSLNEESVITIPEGETFSGSISGITSSSTDDNKDLVVNKGTISSDATLSGSGSEGSNSINVAHTITWKNADGTVLKTDTKKEGDTPSYDGETPTKASDAQYTYTFAGWTPEITSVTGSATYTATFTAVEIPPAPSSSSSSSKGSDSGNYQYFPREVTADGIISFGSSKVVKGMELPAGSSGRVTLNTMPDFEMPENGFYAFEIDAPGYNLDAKINGGLSFQIEAADLEAEGWTAEDIVLYHGTVAEDGTITWEALPTSLVEVENGIAYYKAVINGCSPFYIGFVEDGSIVNEPVVEPSDEPTDVPQDVPGEDLPDIPRVQDEPEEPSTPAPILAVLAGFGVAVVLRRK